MPASLAACVPRVHGHADVGLGQGRGVVGAVAHHGHQLAAVLLLADVGELGLGRRLGDVVVHAGLLGDGLGRQRVVAGDHDGPQAHLPQPLEPLADARLEDVLQHDQADDPVALADEQRRRAAGGDGVDLSPGSRSGTCRPGRWTCWTTASGAPLRMRRPSGRSTPLMRVWAVNSTNRAPGGGRRAVEPPAAGGTARRCSCPRASGRRARPGRPAGPPRAAESPPSGTNCVARRLPIVIVPVLSSSSVSTSPATSTALPLLAMMLARRARSMPAMPMAASRAPIVVGIRQTSSATSVGMSVPRLCSVRRRGSRPCTLGVQGHRPERRGDDQEDQRERRQHQRQGDLVGRPLADGPLDQGDHRSRNDSARLGRDPDDDAVGQDAGAAGDAGAVAAGLADHRGRLAGDGRLVDRGDALDDLAVAGDDLPGLDDDEVAGPQLGRRDDLAARSTRGPSRRKAGVSCAGLPGGCRPGPCRAPRPGPRRSWRTGPSATARRSAPSGRRSGRSPAPVDDRLRSVTIAVRTVPTSTTNITGFQTMSAGSSMTNDCRRSPCGAAPARTGRSCRVWRRWSLKAWASDAARVGHVGLGLEAHRVRSRQDSDRSMTVGVDVAFGSAARSGGTGRAHAPNGIGPRCSATARGPPPAGTAGPRPAAIVPSSTNAEREGVGPQRARR